jgi:outer membrane protein assembly factor BamB
MIKNLLCILFFIITSLGLKAQENYAELNSAFAIGSSFPDAAEFTALDNSGNRIIFGFFGEDLDFDPSEEGENVISPLGSPDLFLASYTSDGDLNWVFNLGRISLNNGMDAGGLAVDSNGDILISGSFSNNVDFDPSAETEVILSQGGKDAFIAKYTSAGELVWVRTMGTLVFETSSALAVDAEGNVYAGITLIQETDVDPGEGEVLITPQGGVDAALLKLDTDGNLLWANHVSPGLENEEINSIGLAPNGTVVIGAFINGITSGIPERTMHAGAYDAEGLPLWSYDFDNQGQSNIISHIAFSEDGESVYLGGRFQAITDFDPSESGQSTISPLFADPFIAKYALADGSLEWVKYIESLSTDDFCAGILERNGLTLFLGSFDVSALIVPGDFNTQVVSNGEADLFAVAYESGDGEYLGASTWGGSGNEIALNYDFTPEGDLILVGQFAGNLQLDPEEEPLPAVGVFDVFWANFSYLTTLSAPEKKVRTEMRIYPVPTANHLYIDLPLVETGKKYEIRLIDVVGKEVRRKLVQANGSTIKLDVGTLIPGIYILELNAGGQKFMKRFVKQ